MRKRQDARGSTSRTKCYGEQCAELHVLGDAQDFNDWGGKKSMKMANVDSYKAKGDYIGAGLVSLAQGTDQADSSRGC